jgi:hypothetical protein
MLGFVLDALWADSETEWSCHSLVEISSEWLSFVQDALRADSKTKWSCHSRLRYQLTDNLSSAFSFPLIQS